MKSLFLLKMTIKPRQEFNEDEHEKGFNQLKSLPFRSEQSNGEIVSRGLDARHIFKERDVLFFAPKSRRKNLLQNRENVLRVVSVPRVSGVAPPPASP